MGLTPGAHLDLEEAVEEAESAIREMEEARRPRSETRSRAGADLEPVRAPIENESEPSQTQVNRQRGVSLFAEGVIQKSLRDAFKASMGFVPEEHVRLDLSPNPASISYRLSSPAEPVAEPQTGRLLCQLGSELVDWRPGMKSSVYFHVFAEADSKEEGTWSPEVTLTAGPGGSRAQLKQDSSKTD